MKKIFFVTITLTSFILTNAQDTGIEFTHADNWQTVLNKAKKENKYIFLDAYATWCGPCKYMSEKIFPLTEAGDYFNQRFINVKVQMDKTKMDTPEVKQWYSDAKMLTDRYSIQAYPTYIIFSPEGKALHRIVGTTKTAADFITKAGDAFEPQKQYYSVIGGYKKHTKDSAFLRNAINVALYNADKINAAAIGNYYISLLKDPYSKDNLSVIRQVTISTKDKGFNMFLKHSGKVDAIIAQGFSEDMVSGIMYDEELKPFFETDKPIDWNAMNRKIKTKYPIISDEKLAFYQYHYYRIKRKIPEYEKAVVDYMNKYGSQLGDYDNNANAWDVFTYSENKTVLQEAIKWSKRSLELVPKTPRSNYVNYMDTYANLLYKMGNTEEAIKWERNVIDLAKKEDNVKIIQTCSPTLIKMEKGEKTWE